MRENMQLRVEPATDRATWDRFVADSPSGTVFATAGFLSAAIPNHAVYEIRRGEEQVGGVVLALDDSGKTAEPDDFLVYSGILFRNTDKRQPVSVQREQFAATEAAAAFIAEGFDGAAFQCAPAVTDVRPFLWHRYNDPGGSPFGVSVRYTSFWHISGIGHNMEDSPVFAAMGRLRRRNIKAALAEGYTVSGETDIEQLASWYVDMMAQQGIAVSSDKRRRLCRLGEFLIGQKRGLLSVCRNAAGRAVYALLSAFDEKRGYALFAAGAPDAPNTVEGTFTYWEAARRLHGVYGVPVFDLEGVNSPMRGWFKEGFGGVLTPYYRIVFHKRAMP